MFMGAAWVSGCGTKAFASLADANDRWATAPVTATSAMEYKNQRAVMTDEGGSQSPVTGYLKSIVVRRNGFDYKATGKSSYLIQREPAMRCTSSYSAVCSVPNSSPDGCFPGPGSVAEQEVDGSSRSPPFIPTALRV